LGADSNRLAVLAWVLIAGLLVIRIPSLAEPAGADQALYAYVGQRILAGDVPYRDAWDQKPPGVHLAYAGLIALWPHESVVAAADLVMAALTGLALVALGRRLAPGTGAGELAAIVYLLLGNPAFGRLGGVRVRAQCEVFIGFAVAAALVAAWRATRTDRPGAFWLAFSGALVGVAVVFKYNAIVYLFPVIALAVRSRLPLAGGRFSWSGWVRDLGWMAAGCALPIVLMLAWLAGAGALDDLYRATVIYNVRYSGETYGGRLAMLGYLVSFPVSYARVDPLWFVGGLATAVLVIRLAWWRGRDQWLVGIAVIWVASACIAIAINGSRGLPQYFVQAAPALALAAGLTGAWASSRSRWLTRTIVLALVLIATARIATLPKLIENTRFDWQGLRGSISRDAYLSHFGNADSGDKYSALAVSRLAALITARTAPTDRIFVFGFSPWAYVGSARVSASRFFWSRPVIIGFEDGRPGYGVSGLLDSLQKTMPRVVVLQERDWDPDVTNSADFFLADPRLSSWLHDNYVETDRLHNFRVWSLRTS
jgi:hypothetical protein